MLAKKKYKKKQNKTKNATKIHTKGESELAIPVE